MGKRRANVQRQVNTNDIALVWGQALTCAYYVCISHQNLVNKMIKGAMNELMTEVCHEKG